MKNEPKGGALPVIAGGALMVVCCAAPVIFGSAAVASIAAWFGNLSIGETAALAGLAPLVVYGAIRLRKTKTAINADKSFPTIE